MHLGHSEVITDVFQWTQETSPKLSGFLLSRQSRLSLFSEEDPRQRGIVTRALRTERAPEGLRERLEQKQVGIKVVKTRKGGTSIKWRRYVAKIQEHCSWKSSWELPHFEGRGSQH